jgi:hypothetical protein
MWKNHYAELFNSVTNNVKEHNVNNYNYDENVEDVVQSEVKSAIS